MDRLSFFKNLTPVQVAALLFWVNLIPTAGAVTILALTFGDVYTDAKGFLFICFLLADIIVQVIYFLQFNFKRHAMNKSLWAYSMIYNGTFALAILIITLVSKIGGLMYLVIYPNLFFYLSWMTYKKIQQ